MSKVDEDPTITYGPTTKEFTFLSGFQSDPKIPNV